MVEAGDEDVPEAVEEGGQREQGGVGGRRQPSGGEVGYHQESEDDAEEGADVGRERRRAPEAGQQVGADRQQGDEEHEAELGVAPDGAHDRRHGVLLGGAGAGGAVVVVVCACAAASWRRALT